MTAIKPDGSSHFWALIFVAAGLVAVEFSALVVFSIENKSLKAALEARAAEDQQTRSRAARLLHELNKMGWQPE